mgnify:CR=1 FL=1|tara:strand:+ start:966 stop:1202 length:237 start_codon:yes stop_codon:yes gene_type:complete
MEEVKLTKEQEILFEVYDKGVQNEDCDLDAYVEKMKQALSIAFVSKSVAKQYAEFCVRCDREGLPLLELDDYIKQYCC